MARAALLALLGWFCAGAAVVAEEITGAEFAAPTDRYPHGALGDPLEWGVLQITVGRKAGREGGLFSGHVDLTYEFNLPDDLVFEDTAPRLWDVDGDGAPEVVVVQSQAEAGARLLIIGLADGKPVFRAATAFIGQRFRWLAPVGAADLDGDGRVEIAYVETPHLGRTLKIVRLNGSGLVAVAEAPGLTNHKNGDPDIQGGIATCAGRPTILTADADWTRVMATTLAEGKLSARDFGPYTGADSLDPAKACR
ncbi:MAG: VCBS repeat-containing protein [Albidovulum sp.]